MAKVLRISHIGLAVASGAEAAGFWRALGLPVEGEETVASEAVNVSFLPIGESHLELLEPHGEEGPVQKFLTNRGEGIHHICLEVDDLRGIMAQLQSAGVELTSPEPRRGAGNSLVAFIHPRAAHGVLIELVQYGTEDGRRKTEE